eukprot:CAMPEP_0204623996 /NCGR_PEP_ID=MMETSP0717-20131115/9757_1 /ASSEMBLY_ACC=CAM_ASM_000666 /TAXON_ID=230516 /ORGANISM="Chaetoceros curvisetus" /LENGTH=66 /DNA_ID=CAMNT_0051639247 /DNA_START=186 /DNA_END=386 /DNA_ORIENTATION=+
MAREATPAARVAPPALMATFLHESSVSSSSGGMTGGQMALSCPHSEPMARDPASNPTPPTTRAIVA